MTPQVASFGWEITNINNLNGADVYFEVSDAMTLNSVNIDVAFVPGSSQLHEILQARGIDTLIITGTATNVCCESTARDAMQMNYKVIFVADGNAALSDAEHNATLNNMVALFADVMTTEEAIGALDKAAAMRQAAE